MLALLRSFVVRLLFLSPFEDAPDAIPSPRPCDDAMGVSGAECTRGCALARRMWCPVCSERAETGTRSPRNACTFISLRLRASLASAIFVREAWRA